MNSPGMRWYAVNSQPRKESLALENLERQGYESWLPLVSRSVRKNGRWATKIEPLFARYLFVNVDVTKQDISPIRSTFGCVGLVRQGGLPVAVPVGVVEALQDAVDPVTGLHRLSETGAPVFQRGDRVRVLGGPFEGLEGVFQRPTAEARAMVLLKLLGSVASVRLNQHDLGRVTAAAVSG